MASERKGAGEGHGGRGHQRRAERAGKGRRLTQLPASAPLRLAAPRRSRFGEGRQDGILEHSP
jgi:hypothetical protein